LIGGIILIGFVVVVVVVVVVVPHGVPGNHKTSLLCRVSCKFEIMRRNTFKMIMNERR